VHVGQICVHIILKNFNLGLLSVCLLIIVFNIKAAKCLNILTGRLYISRDVLFEETIFPFQNKSTHQSESPSLGPNFPQPIHSFPAPLQAHLPIISSPNTLHPTSVSPSHTQVHPERSISTISHVVFIAPTY
jgi:hypothetical protein